MYIKLKYTKQIKYLKNRYFVSNLLHFYHSGYIKTMKFLNWQKVIKLSYQQYIFNFKMYILYLSTLKWQNKPITRQIIFLILFICSKCIVKNQNNFHKSYFDYCLQSYSFSLNFHSSNIQIQGMKLWRQEWRTLFHK